MDTLNNTNMMSEMAIMIVNTLDLELAPEDIEPDAPLFGDGLGLDSIDALELSLEIAKRYGVEIKAEDEKNQHIFASLRNLATYVQQHSAQ